MKSILYSFIFGIIIGGVTIYLFLNNSSPVRASMKITSSNPNTKITEQSIEVKSKHKTVIAKASFTTDKKGTFTNEITLNRQDLQFKNSIYAQSGYFINSQLIFLDLGYSYKWLLISAKVGYSFRLNELDYGIGIGGKVSF